MNNKIRWGILGAANIAVKKVIPAMQQGEFSEISAIASRDLAKAENAAKQLGITKFYGTYEELLGDAEIDAIYNPLPNHLHVPWTIKAAEAGKHVLCEKPIGLNAVETQKLIEVRNRTGVKIQEAFMVRTHPQWIMVRQLISYGRIGKLQSINGFFSYFNRDEQNIRNDAEMGGGALMDIGCYPINISRFIFDEEPQRVSALIAKDADFGTDKLTSAILDFPSGQASFTCSTQLIPFQRMQFFGTMGRIEVEIPFNIPPNEATHFYIDNSGDLFGKGIEKITVAAVDQYTIQGDLFSRSILENTAQSISLEDSVKNMAVIEAVFRAAETGKWELPVSAS